MRKKLVVRGRFGAGRLPAALMITAMMASVVIGIGDTAGAARATGTPLKFGIITSDAGPGGTPQQSGAFKAYVANWNAHGGYKGHPIDIIDIDAGTDTSATADAARTLVNDGVIALVDDYAPYDCQNNNTFYESVPIAVLLPAAGLPGCTSQIDFPTYKTTGSEGLTPILGFAIDQGAKKIGFLSIGFPGVKPIAAVSEAYVASRKAKLIVPPYLPYVPSGADIDAALATLKAQGATAVFSIVQSSTAVMILQQAANLGFGPSNGIKYLWSGTSIPLNNLKPFNGSYMDIDSYPDRGSNAPATTAIQIQAKAAYAILHKAKVSPLLGEAQLGWQQAGIFQQVLNNVKGSVTRASFIAAAKRTTKAAVPLLPGVTVNLANPNADKYSGYMLKIEGNKLVLVGGLVVTTQ